MLHSSLRSPTLSIIDSEKVVDYGDEGGRIRLAWPSQAKKTMNKVNKDS